MNETRVLFLHGAPAVGKLTVAKAIAAMTRSALVDNHILIDFAQFAQKGTCNNYL